jgi:hypothetical protein
LTDQLAFGRCKARASTTTAEKGRGGSPVFRFPAHAIDRNSPPPVFVAPFLTADANARLLRGHVPEGREWIVHSGRFGHAHIQLMDIAVMLASFRAEGPHSGAALARFDRYFVGQLSDVYGPG